jgi:hypothetical protein
MRLLTLVVLTTGAAVSLSIADQGLAPRQDIDALLSRRDVIDELWNTLLSGATCAACEVRHRVSCSIFFCFLSSPLC